MKATTKDIIDHLRSLSDPSVAEKMEYFAISNHNAFGITTPVLRSYAKTLGRNHALALELWKTKNYEARVIAALIDEPSKVTGQQMEAWVKEFDNWAICDCCCSVLFDKTPFAYDKAMQWSLAEEEYIKRAGFSLMAALAIHDKKASDVIFISFFKRIEEEAHDERNFVKKAVNWALRQIGKRNLRLHAKAVLSAKKIQKQPHKSARWIAADALRELQNEKIIERIKLKSK